MSGLAQGSGLRTMFDLMISFGRSILLELLISPCTAPRFSTDLPKVTTRVETSSQSRVQKQCRRARTCVGIVWFTIVALFTEATLSINGRS